MGTGDDSWEEFYGAIDSNGICSFSIGGFDEPYVNRQYWVVFEDGVGGDVGDGQFSSFIEAIVPSTAPAIPNPVFGAAGTSITANPGGGQGMRDRCRLGCFDGDF